MSPRILSIVSYRYVTPAQLAVGRSEDGYRVEEEPLQPDYVEAMAAMLDQNLVAYEVEAEVHRDTGVCITEHFHTAEDYTACRCGPSVTKAATSTRTAERSIFVKVWIVEPEEEVDLVAIHDAEMQRRLDAVLAAANPKKS
jgi:hypothetical protein